MRGKLSGWRGNLKGWGITPAHAGKTRQRLYRHLSDRDHPRACGENRQSCGLLTFVPGSPPRMRGKPGETMSDVGTWRITPAHAGKTVLRCTVRLRKRDHPRACGENVSFLTVNDGVQGITPAHAGKTLPRRDFLRTLGDHPRACGENTIKSEVVRVTWGSPPRMRGKLLRNRDDVDIERITPAHAGKTRQRRRRRSSRRDHPRACGENGMSGYSRASTPGSPPRMRGKPHGVKEPGDVGRITPAHAGKTVCCYSSR